MLRPHVLALLFLAACKSATQAPPPAPQLRGEPQEITITAAAPSAQKRPMPLPPKGPPEVERGRTISVDWQGKGLAQGEVLDVRGNWVKLRFIVLEKGPEPNTTIGSSVEAWVDFSRVGYYVPGSMEKRKMKRKGEIQ